MWKRKLILDSKKHHKIYNFWARSEGIEPSLAVLETAVLPLNDDLKLVSSCLQMVLYRKGTFDEMLDAHFEQNEIVGYPADRGIDGYAGAYGMSRTRFLNWLAGKNRVLDIGSGGGLLRKEIDLMKYKGSFTSRVVVTPVDIIYGTKEGIEHSRYATHLALSSLNLTPTKELLEMINGAFERDARPDSFTSLSFPSGSFDAVLACYSFGIHAVSKDQSIRAYKEAYRVLKRGGEGLISVSYDTKARLLYSGSWQDPVFYSFEDIYFFKPKLKVSNDGYYLNVRR